jgi:hypothetical protein
MVFLMGAAAILFFAEDALAFRHTMTCTESGPYACGPDEEPKPLHWSARCVRYQINEDALHNVRGITPDVADLAEIRRAVSLSFAAWTNVDCSDMTLVDGGLTGANQSTFRAGDSRNTNLVVWRSEGWSKVATARAFALTSVTFNPKNGLIADADIEVNTEFYTFSAGETPLPNHVDLRNTLTHEVGHFVGLDHSDVFEATMFSTAPVGEVAKRSLHPDDINALCATYPGGVETQSQCLRASDFPSAEDLDLDSPACSAIGGGEQPGGAALILLGLLSGVMAIGRRTIRS